MCGRFTHLYTWAQLHKLMTLTSPPIELPLRFNVAPMQMAPVVRAEDGGRALDMLRWGLVPSWAKDEGIASSLINARAETVASKPAFRAAFKRRRCVVPASGFYEWQQAPVAEEGLFGVTRGKPAKRPHYITRADGQPMIFAGLWESWRDPGAPEGTSAPLVETFTIITCEPNAMMSRLHDRMPVILDLPDLARWLDPGSDAESVARLLGPFPADRMTAHPVSTRVNSPRNDDAECLQPV